MGAPSAHTPPFALGYATRSLETAAAAKREAIAPGSGIIIPDWTSSITSARLGGIEQRLSAVNGALQASERPPPTSRRTIALPTSSAFLASAMSGAPPPRPAARFLAADRKAIKEQKIRLLMRLDLVVQSIQEATEGPLKISDATKDAVKMVTRQGLRGLKGAAIDGSEASWQNAEARIKVAGDKIKEAERLLWNQGALLTSMRSPSSARRSPSPSPQRVAARAASPVQARRILALPGRSATDAARALQERTQEQQRSSECVSESVDQLWNALRRPQQSMGERRDPLDAPQYDMSYDEREAAPGAAAAQQQPQPQPLDPSALGATPPGISPARVDEMRAYDARIAQAAIVSDALASLTEEDDGMEMLEELARLEEMSSAKASKQLTQQETTLVSELARLEKVRDATFAQLNQVARKGGVELDSPSRSSEPTRRRSPLPPRGLLEPAEDSVAVRSQSRQSQVWPPEHKQQQQQQQQQSSSSSSSLSATASSSPPPQPQFLRRKVSPTQQPSRRRSPPLHHAQLSSPQSKEELVEERRSLARSWALKEARRAMEVDVAREEAIANANAALATTALEDEVRFMFASTAVSRPPPPPGQPPRSALTPQQSQRFDPAADPEDGPFVPLRISAKSAPRAVQHRAVTGSPGASLLRNHHQQQQQQQQQQAMRVSRDGRISLRPRRSPSPPGLVKSRRG